MRTILVGLLSSTLVGVALLSAGCANVVISDERTKEDGLEQQGASPGTQGGDVASTPPTEDTKKPKPEPDDCISSEVGDGVTCQDTLLMKKQAYDICVQAGLELVVYDVNNNGCTFGESRRAEYSCCGADGQCINGEISDEVLCQTFAALHDQAAGICASAGLQVTDVHIDNESCQYLDSTRARYSCCPAAHPNP